jgi:hypothetical protein
MPRILEDSVWEQAADLVGSGVRTAIRYDGGLVRM